MRPPFYRGIASPADVEEARRQARAMVFALGVGSLDAEAVVLAVSELSANLVRYAYEGRIVIAVVDAESRTGVVIESVDAGPGIADIEQALTDGFSTGGGLGSGLPAVRRLMDEFEITSAPNGTHIMARKWLTRR